MPKAFRWISLVGLSVLALPSIPALVLLLVARTAAGRAVSSALVLLLAALIVLPMKRHWAPRAALSLAAGAALVFFTVAARWEPPRSGSRYASVYTDGEASRWALGSLVPERDQVAVGVRLVRYLDRYTDGERARTLEALVEPMYQAMSEDPELEGLGSAMPLAYAELWAQRFDPGHLFISRPPGPRKPGRAGLIFLHGSVGNFKSYVYVLARLAEGEDLVIAHPSFGFGNWTRRGGVPAIERARRWLIEREGVDPKKIVLVGLSNGGLGVSLAAAAQPEAYLGIGFISPVFEDEVVRTEAFREGWRDRPVLILSGEDDERVPIRYVRATAQAIAANGAKLTAHYYPGQDHFLWFRARDEGLADLSAWMRGFTSRAGSGTPDRGAPHTADGADPSR